jgi:hypothetical protein
VGVENIHLGRRRRFDDTTSKSSVRAWKFEVSSCRWTQAESAIEHNAVKISQLPPQHSHSIHEESERNLAAFWQSRVCT